VSLPKQIREYSLERIAILPDLVITVLKGLVSRI